MLKASTDEFEVAELSPNVAELRQFWEVLGKPSQIQPLNSPHKRNRQCTPPLQNQNQESDATTIPCIDENIVFALKTLVVNNTKVTEIEFCCTLCQSAFVLRAAHQCVSSDDPSQPDTHKRQQGLEWYRNQKCDHINMII